MKIIILNIFLSAVVYLSASESWAYLNELDEFTDKPKQLLYYGDKDHDFIIQSIEKQLYISINRKKTGKPYKITYLDDGRYYQDTKLFFRVDKMGLYSFDVGLIMKMAKMLASTDTHGTSIINNMITIKRMQLKSSLGAEYKSKDKNDTLSYEDVLICDMVKGNYLNVRYLTEFDTYESFKISLKGFKKAFKKAFEGNLIFMPTCLN